MGKSLIQNISLSNCKVFAESFHASVLLRSLTQIVHRINRVTGMFTEGSLFCQFLDYVILFALAALIISLTFSTTGIIGFLILFCFMLMIFKVLITPKFSFSIQPIDIPIIAFLCVGLISTCFSSYFSSSLEGLSKLLLYFALYLTYSGIFRSRLSILKMILFVMIFACGVESFYGMYQSIVGVEALATWQDPDTIRADNYMDRIYGSLKPLNPNLLAGYTIPGVAFSLGLGFMYLYKKSLLLSGIFFGFFALNSYVVYQTGSRGAYLAIATVLFSGFMSVGHMLYHDFKNQKRFFYVWIIGSVALLVGMILFILINPALMDRIQSIFTLRDNSSNSFRMNVYLASFQMFLDNWLIGIGLGNDTFRLVYGLYMRTGFDALSAYSIYLETAVEMGIIGLLTFFWLVYIVFYHSIAALSWQIDITVKILILTMVVALIGILTHGLVDTIFFRPQVQVQYWFILASLASLIKYAHEQHTQKL